MSSRSVSQVDTGYPLPQDRPDQPPALPILKTSGSPAECGAHFCTSRQEASWSNLGLTHTDVRGYQKQHHGNSKDMEPGQGQEGGVESTGLLWAPSISPREAGLGGQPKQFLISYRSKMGCNGMSHSCRGFSLVDRDRT